jgi:TonB family protein
MFSTILRLSVFVASVIVVCNYPALSQSGRRIKESKPSPPAVEEPTKESPPPEQNDNPPITAEKNQEYMCTDDGTLARILDTDTGKEKVFTSKQVDTKATILSKPAPSYSREARRAGIRGYVILKVVLSSTGKIGRIKVLRGLPFGLTENGIRAACKIKFQPAVKDGQPVSQTLQVDYAFSLSHSPIFRP